MSSNRNKLCVSLIPESMNQLYSWLDQIGEADLVELRLDHFQHCPIHEIKEKVALPVIFTIRLPEEGGYWKGSEQERVNNFQKAINAGVEFIDIEWKAAQKTLPALRFNETTRLILSFHTAENDLEILKRQLHEMVKLPADVYKLIFTAHEFDDNLTAYLLWQEAQKLGIKYVIHAMGEHGTLSRLWGAIFGNEWTYVSLDGAAETATGQISLGAARKEYFLPEKTPQTRLVGLLGYPIAQSSGWRLHNRLLHKKKTDVGNSANRIKDFLYTNFPVKDFESFWPKWKDLLYGLSVTIPHKETVVSYLTSLSPEVQVSGVCNTIFRRDGVWWGINADLLAIKELLKPYAEGCIQSALIIGTGATARSAIAALLQLGISPEKIFVSGRNTKKGEFLQNYFNIGFVPQQQLFSYSVDCIIQTTPVGMFPNVEEVPPGTDLFHEGMVVLDVIYNPEYTQFLKIAKDKGCHVISGREMFLRQAAYQFEIYSGVRASVEEIRSIWEEIHLNF